MEKTISWRQLWPAPWPDNLDYPFYEADPETVDDERGDLVSKISDAKLLSYLWKQPSRSVKDIAEIGIEVGGSLVARWPNPWGLAVGLSLADTWTAMFLVDDFELGRFAALGVRFIDGIAFGVPLRIYNDVEQAAKYAFAYGIPHNVQESVIDAFEKKTRFPVNGKSRRLWGRGTDSYSEEYLDDALRSLQAYKGVDPKTAIAATKTLELTYE